MKHSRSNQQERRKVRAIDGVSSATNTYRGAGRDDLDYRLIFEESPEGMVVFRAESGEVLDTNLEARLLLAKRWEDLLVAGRDEILDPEDPFLREALAEVRCSGRWKGELRLLRRGGKPFTAEVSMFVLGEEGLVCAAFREAGGHERALRESEERFRITFDQAAIGIAHVSPDGRFLRINRRLCEIVGYDREELLKKTFQDITHPEDLDADLEQVRQVLSGEIETFSMEKRYFRKDGSTVWVCLTVSLVRGPSEEPLYFISIVDDIDERKRAEKLLRSLTDQEVEVLKLLARGLTNKEVAKGMNFSMATAKVHVQRILAKLGASCRAEAAAQAVKFGLVEAE